MGITIKSINFSADMGYFGFKRFRDKVAELSNEEFWKHYTDCEKAMFLLDEKRKDFFKKYNAKTEKLVENNIVSEEIANFCYQCDCEGSIDQEQAKQIYDKIKHYDDNTCYGYAGRRDCAMFSDLKSIFKDCAENGGTVDWS
jgi:hypothetical protein